MAASLSDILTAIQNGVTALNSFNQTVARIFPGATALSTTAPSSVGAITFTSSQTKGFISIVTSSGYAGKMPIY
jgi:hypothetical protein